MPGTEPMAHLGGLLATDLLDVTDDLAALDGSGFWAVVVTFEGAVTLARFADVRPAPLPVAGSWSGPQSAAWSSSLDHTAYVRGVQAVREHIAAGDVYQVNLCRVLSAPLPEGTPNLLPLAHRLAAGNPAPYAGYVHLPEHGVQVLSASPELYLRRRGDTVWSSPMKGTGRTAADLLDKDAAENVMIVDLVRNDLGRVCETGSVRVSSFLALEQHPGLVQLVSTVAGELRSDVGWAQLFEVTFPPGSVSGAPKSSALSVIDELETSARGPYCGAVGWVDADRGGGELAVGIRTFWVQQDRLCFGTGAGITWASDAEGEWAETELKAHRLVGLASGTGPHGDEPSAPLP